MSTFYVVATPIGNLNDITFRAIETLKKVDFILCEDTRVTKKLLARYEINTPTISYHSQSKISKIEKIFELLKNDKDLALVSDAGTPLISDPGVVLLSKIKEHFLGDVKIIPIPGVSALTTLLSVAFFDIHQFTFVGFLPHKKGREKILKEIAISNRAFIFYESPHRIIKTLEMLNNLCPEKKIFLGREMTKIYEQFISGKAKELLKYFADNQEKLKGEFSVIVNN